MSKVVVSTKPLRGKHIPTLQKIMEISKSLQEEILSVQNKLKNAIRDHQICVEKLKDEPKNTKILEQIQQIQIYIVSLGRRQKQVVQRLRMEVETLKAENANGSKVSVASLLGLNNNNHINNNNEAKEETTDSKKINGLVNAIKKEDYEEEIRNTDNSSPSQENDDSNRERSNSVETISYEDDVVEISGDENSSEKQDMEEEFSVESSIQVSFLGTLGLITTTKSIELQNRKTERKRRSTANPQFVYSNWELPTKRKRHSYLQSAGKAPQTRQSTARSVGPSPPPGKILFNKSLPPSTKNASKTLISTQKLAAKPNILRNGSENKAFNKNGTENAQLQNNKSIASKVVHIPGLPSSLTIERIEADSAVCISCRNPGTLTVCQQCSSNYHISCHSTSPPPPKICPSCVLNSKENTSFPGVIKKENELEEKERERYDLRERNSELRLQVYELEKRSQLLSQSLQLQRRTQQEVLGKQEKTQKSIKRLVDFIKLMQQQKEVSSLPTSESINCLPPLTSSPSPQTQCVSPITQSSTVQSMEPIHQKSESSTSSPILEISPTSTNQKLISQITPVKMQTTVISTNPTSSLKKDQSQQILAKDHLANNSESKTTQSLTINCQVLADTAQPTENQNCLSPNALNPQIGDQKQTILVVKSQINAVCPASTESARPTINNTSLIVHQQTKKPAMISRIFPDSATYSTHCSQSITTPISSPAVQTNHKEQVEQTTQTIGTFLKSNNRHVMTEQNSHGASSPQIVPNT